eukprot:11022600-Ditylum_brightwellii.AAC.1
MDKEEFDGNSKTSKELIEMCVYCNGLKVNMSNVKKRACKNSLKEFQKRKDKRNICFEVRKITSWSVK